MASIMLTNYWLKFIDLSLFIICAFICAQMSYIDVFNPEKSIPINMIKI